METYYVLKFAEPCLWSGNFVKVNSWSMGFPEARWSVTEATLFKTRDEAEAYATMFDADGVRKDHAIEPVAYKLTLEVTR